MEYVIGIYILGWVICSLYIVCQVKANFHNFKRDKWYNLMGIGIFTCTIWPVFLGWILYCYWKDLTIL